MAAVATTQPLELVQVNIYYWTCISNSGRSLGVALRKTLLFSPSTSIANVLTHALSSVPVFLIKRQYTESTGGSKAYMVLYYRMHFNSCACRYPFLKQH